MSRTYRKNPYGHIKFCNNCNRPVWHHTKEVYELCDCPDKYVEIQVRNYKYVEHPDYYFGKPVENGWRTVKKRLPKSTYYRYDVKMIDGECGFPYNTNAGIRKDAQKYRNSKMRSKTKQILKNKNIPYEDMVFPIKKNEVDWDVF